MALAQRTIHRTATLVLITVGMLAAFAGCHSGSSSTSTSFRTLAIFRGSSGSSETAHFITNGDWELYWTCDPTSYTGPANNYPVPFPLTIGVENGGPSPVVTPVNITCENSSSSVGTVDVHQSGEQWLVVVAGGAGGNWIAIVSVPQSDTGAKLVSPTPRTSVDR